jgi:hypothetical protein
MPQASVSSAESTAGRASTAESIPRFGTTDLTDAAVLSGCLGENPGISPSFTLVILVFRSQSYGHLPVTTGYKWDYTFYKWGYKYL